MKIEMMPEGGDPPSLEAADPDGKKAVNRFHAADPADTQGLWPAPLARVPGEGEEDEEWADMEEKIRSKYQPSKLDVSGPPPPAACHLRADPAASIPSGRDVHVCNGCDGQGKVYKTFALSDLGSEGAQRVLESCCQQQCEGMGVLYPNRKPQEAPPRAGGERDQAQGAAPSSGRLDQDDPKVDMEAILAAAGPSPFDRPRKSKANQ